MRRRLGCGFSRRALLRDGVSVQGCLHASMSKFGAFLAGEFAHVLQVKSDKWVTTFRCEVRFPWGARVSIGFDTAEGRRSKGCPPALVAHCRSASDTVDRVPIVISAAGRRNSSG